MKERFLKDIAPFCKSQEQGEGLFTEIKKRYTQKSRAYHNFVHLTTMLDLADEFQKEIDDTDILRISIWYHDLIYKALRKDNELKSAVYAKAVLQELNCNAVKIKKCYHQILLTQKHHVDEADGLDEQLLIDFDLEILSRDWESYKLYTQQIRKEYWMYPGPIYRKGRREAMQHFLERAYIYQSPHFQKHKEGQARENIVREIESLR